jgi:hypothetical protein
MDALRILSIVGVVVMASAIIFGIASGDFSEEGGEIVALAWGKVSLVDLYVGLAFFGAWVAFREKRTVAVAAWWIGLVVLGNLAAAAYLAIAAFRADTPEQILLGRRADTQ